MNIHFINTAFNKMAPVPTLLRNVVQGAILPLRGLGKLAYGSFQKDGSNNNGGNMTEKEFSMMHGTLCGKFSRADTTGIYAVAEDEGERLVGHWQRPRGSQIPEIKSITKEDDCYVLEIKSDGRKLYLLT